MKVFSYLPTIGTSLFGQHCPSSKMVSAFWMVHFGHNDLSQNLNNMCCSTEFRIWGCHQPLWSAMSGLEGFTHQRGPASHPLTNFKIFSFCKFQDIFCKCQNILQILRYFANFKMFCKSKRSRSHILLFSRYFAKKSWFVAMFSQL